MHGRATATAPDFLAEGGELGALMRSHDWSTSPLGWPEGWPQSLRSVVSLLLTSKFPMFLAWGPDLAFLYNDGYRPIFGAKHPRALGLPFREVWSEIWTDIEPLVAKALAGEATFHENLHLVMERNGYPEDTWYTFSYSPLRDEGGGVAGLFCACQETTSQVLADRRAAQRRELEERLRESEARFRNLADHAPVMMWVTDQTGYCTYLNRRWYEFTGQSPAEAEGYGWLKATHPDDRARAEEAFVAANARQGEFRVEYRLRAADGTYRWAIDAAGPRFGDDGAFLGYVGSVIDISERRAIEEALRTSESRLRSLTDTLPAFVWFATQNGELHYLNDRWYEYTGQIPQQALPNGWQDAVHPDDRALTAVRWAEARAQGGLYEVEVRYRRVDGVYRWYLVRAEPMRDEAEVIVAWCGTSIDVDGQKRAEEHQKLLINELNHRVKNTLATVQSVASQTLRNAASTEAAREAFEGRLMALSKAHDVLTRENWEGADLHDIVAQALEPYNSPAEDRLHLAGPRVRLLPRTALALAMAMQELATNAAKYGALSNAAGEIRITWSVEAAEGSPRLKLRWAEAGGPLVETPARRGFGTRLIERSLAQDLDGAVHIGFAPTGVVCTIDAPLPTT